MLKFKLIKDYTANDVADISDLDSFRSQLIETLNHSKAERNKLKAIRIEIDGPKSRKTFDERNLDKEIRELGRVAQLAQEESGRRKRAYNRAKRKDRDRKFIDHLSDVITEVLGREMRDTFFGAAGKRLTDEENVAKGAAMNIKQSHHYEWPTIK